MQELIENKLQYMYRIVVMFSLRMCIHHIKYNNYEYALTHVCGAYCTHVSIGCDFRLAQCRAGQYGSIKVIP